MPGDVDTPCPTTPERAIRRTGCSFVFRSARNQSSLLARLFLARLRNARSSVRREREHATKGAARRPCLIQTIIVDSRLEIHPADASSFFCRETTTRISPTMYKPIPLATILFFRPLTHACLFIPLDRARCRF